MKKSTSASSSFETRPLPKTFVLELTQRCNNRCSYCYNMWDAPTLGADRCNQYEMSTTEIKQVIAKLQDETPLESLALSGGEPLLRKDLPEILTYIKNRGIASVVITNGTLLTEERVASTVVGGIYEVTLLSYKKEIHDELAGRRGAWDAAVSGIANVKKAGGKVVAVFVATKINYMDVSKTAELAIALGAYGLMYNRMNLGVNNQHLADDLLPTAAMIQENLDSLEDVTTHYGLPIGISVVIEPCVVDIRKYQHIHFGWCPLAGKDSYFTIDPTGNIRICNHSPTILGNIKRESFTNIYYKHPYVREFRETWPDECIECPSELKELCRGGCKAAAEQCHGNLRQVDPFVTLCR